MMMIRRTFIQAAVAASLVIAVLGGPIRAETADDAQKFIQGLAQRAITTVADKQLTATERNDRFRTLFVSAFDIPEIGRFVLSRYWRTATPEQQKDFLGLFAEINVLTWAKRFQEYNGESLDTLGASNDSERNWSVDSRILRPQGPPIPVQWHLRQGEDGAFRVVDIVVEGVSMAITLRSDYTATVQSNSGKVDSLLSAMRTKLDQLRAAG
jgi:phospholipid transport system substrate-binding protein